MMAGDINTVVLVGRVTRDAELRYTGSGTALCNFSVAVGRRVKKGDEWTNEASFFDLTLWDKQAENLKQYLVKGTQVAVQGELRQERWEKDGQKHSKVAVFVSSLQLLGGGKREGSAPAPSGSQGESGPADAYEDDIPFAPHRC
jgi:single-strand DNA-binding protein